MSLGIIKAVGAGAGRWGKGVKLLKSCAHQAGQLPLYPHPFWRQLGASESGNRGLNVIQDSEIKLGWRHFCDIQFWSSYHAEHYQVWRRLNLDKGAEWVRNNTAARLNLRCFLCVSVSRAIFPVDCIWEKLPRDLWLRKREEPVFVLILSKFLIKIKRPAVLQIQLWSSI